MSSKTIGITGAGGFIGRHFTLRAARLDGWSVRLCSHSTFDDPAALRDFVSSCDAIVHLAGMNRGDDVEIYSVNVGLASKLTDALTMAAVSPHVVYASSTQEQANNVYGNAKQRAGEILAAWAQSSGGALSHMVIPNVYGAGCRPFYNSVVATFCHQLARGETPTILVDKEVEFICVSELVDAIACQRGTSSDSWNGLHGRQQIVGNVEIVPGFVF